MTPNQKGFSRPSNPSSSSHGKAPASDNATQVEKKEKPLTVSVSAIKALVVCEVYRYNANKNKLAEACAGIINIAEAEKYLNNPSLSMVYHCLMATAVNMGSRDIRILPKFGHVLAYSLHKIAKEKENGRDEILESIAEFCDASIEFRTQLFIATPSFWIFLAEILSNAILPTPGLFEGDPPTLGDFKMAFIYAADDARKPYALFIQVLKRLEEIHCMREKGKYYSDAARKIYRKMTYWVAITANREDFKSIIKVMDVDKLTEELKNSKTNFNCNLYTILNESGCL